MIKIDNPKAVIRASTDAHSYLKLLQSIGVFKQMVDGYTFAAAYSIKNNGSTVIPVVSTRYGVSQVRLNLS